MFSKRGKSLAHWIHNAPGDLKKQKKLMPAHVERS